MSSTLPATAAAAAAAVPAAAAAAADAINGPGADLAHAQTTIEVARERNLKRQADGSKKAQALHIKPQPMSAWSGKLRLAFECDFFAPGTLGDAMTLGPEKVTMEYKEMKHCLQGGTRAFKPALLSELPETAAQEWKLKVRWSLVPILRSSLHCWAAFAAFISVRPGSLGDLAVGAWHLQPSSVGNQVEGTRGGSA